MDFVQWEERYSVGVPSIDDQHKKLIGFTNTLFSACQEGPEAAGSVFRKTLKEVVAYVKEHFTHEETLLQNNGYPDFPAHKKEHEQFVFRVLEEVAAFESGKKFVPNHFVRFLREWLLQHIAVSDHNYSDFLVSRNVS